ncbi:MAG: glutathione transferase GstA [Legionellaceae bacterium]|nr:glutathione transferase GstA [Legionellaceae bacterium]MBP9775883.1 glutathione transferase GstA [Legionellaceae bacterium]
MKLFYAKGACSLASRIILNEIGIAPDFEAVDLQTKQTERGQNFLSVNPKGCVPTLRLENGEILTENAVIMQYLADHYEASNLLPPVGDWQRYRVLEWLNYVSTELHKGFAPIFNPDISQELKETIFIPKVMEKFQYIDRDLKSRAYLVGKHFTLPDAYLFTVLRWAIGKKLPVQPLQSLMDYAAQLRLRKSVSDAMIQEGLTQ